jgi:MFS family permease
MTAARPDTAPLHRLVLPLLLAASSLTVMAGATIAPSLPALRDHFRAVPQADLLVRLVLTSPGLAIALAAPIAGALADRFGRKPLLIAGMALYAAAGASGLVLESLAAILVGRILLGVAVGMVMTTASALIGDLFAGGDRDRALRLQAAFMGFGGVVFLLAGGALAEVSWRGPFAIYLAPLLLLPVMLRLVPEPSLTARGSVAEAPFPWRTVARVYALALVGMVAFYIIPVQLPFLLRSLGSGQPSIAGIGIATATLTSALTSLLLLRPVRARLSVPATLALSLALIGAGYAVIGLAPGPAQVFAGLGLAGVGLGLQMPVLAAWLQGSVSPAVRARAMGGYTTAVFLGQFVSPFLHGPGAAWVGYSGSYLITAALCVALAIGLAAALSARKAA